uniref:Cystatin domain-containing protein n=1 Tax=Strongyloides venezuelensis TaxID=75913 RepID=A0A0K0FN04_STRVS
MLINHMIYKVSIIIIESFTKMRYAFILNVFGILYSISISAIVIPSKEDKSVSSFLETNSVIAKKFAEIFIEYYNKNVRSCRKECVRISKIISAEYLAGKDTRVNLVVEVEIKNCKSRKKRTCRKRLLGTVLTHYLTKGKNVYLTRTVKLYVPKTLKKEVVVISHSKCNRMKTS